MGTLFRGLTLAAIAGTAMLSTALPNTRFALRPNPPSYTRMVRRPQPKRRKGAAPKGRSAQRYKSRLIADRSSSFKKLQRWVRADPSILGSITPARI